MATAKTRTIDPWKAKRWYPVYGPESMRRVFIGETPASEREKVLGREVRISLAAVTGEIKKQSTNVTFRITALDGNNAVSEIRKIEIASSHIRRQVRKGRDRIDDVFALKDSEGKSALLKILIITRGKINNSKKTLLKKLARQELRDYVAKIQRGQLVQDILSSRLQKTLNQSLRRVCPLRSFDIRVLELAGELASPQAAAAPAAETVNAEAQEPEIAEAREAAEEKKAGQKQKGKKPGAGGSAEPVEKKESSNAPSRKRQASPQESAE